MTSDAKNIGIGLAIFDVYEDGSEKPISFASRMLSSNKLNYSATDNEALARIFGIKKFNNFLFSKKFLIIADNNI